MRLLRQISLDNPILRNGTSSTTSGVKSEPSSPTCKLTRIFHNNIDQLLQLVTDLKNVSSNTCSKDDQNVLKLLEELNSNIVHIIQLSINEQAAKLECRSPTEKYMSKLRRQYSSFVETGQMLLKKSLTTQVSESPPHPSWLDIPSPSDVEAMEEVIQKLIESKVILLLVNLIANVGFEEKKLIRIIITNLLILEINQKRLVVEHFCDLTSGILQALVQSYEIGRSDVTLNCGFILRFASQYKPVVATLLRADFFYRFFDYMQRSSRDYSFDVAMDVFFTFKTILTRHKDTTAPILQVESGKFFGSFIRLLLHADEKECYVTKRQSLEIFSDILEGPECVELRQKFVTHDHFIVPVIGYLWNRNTQIRLRCLVLLNQLFQVNESTDQPDKENQDDFTLNENCSKSIEKWNLELFVKKVKIFSANPHDTQYTTNSELESLFQELKVECIQSNIKLFTSQSTFIAQIISALASN